MGAVTLGLRAGGAQVGQLWLFVVAPFVGAALAGLASRWLQGEGEGSPT